MTEKTPPTLYEWAGGMPAFERLTEILYRRVADEPLLAHLFENSDAGHAKHVAQFIAEVFGGPKRYSSERGGHPNMIAHHVGKKISEEQRRRWMQLIVESADEARLPDDPEFRSAFVAYVEWGSRLAVINSKPDTQVNPETGMPDWGWGAAGGPYEG